MHYASLVFKAESVSYALVFYWEQVHCVRAKPGSRCKVFLNAESWIWPHIQRQNVKEDCVSH